MVLRWKRKKEEKEAPAVVLPESVAIEPPESVAKADSYGRIGQAIESLDVSQSFQLRRLALQREIDDRLWKAGAVGGDREARERTGHDISWLEFAYKAESLYVELRCSLVTTDVAPNMIVEARQQLDALQDRVGTGDYLMAVMGMIQSCLKEQDMGLTTVPKSIWNFSEVAVHSDYLRAIKRSNEIWKPKKEDDDE